MKCDRCERPAVVHELTVRNGVKSEVHLCEECARDLGIVVPANQPIEQILTQFVVGEGAAGPAGGPPAKTRSPRPRGRRCETCGMGLTEFRRTGILGCPDCYTAFGDALAGVIERAQAGGTSHVGKAPRRTGGSIDRQLLVRRLLTDLEAAVSAEQFERAAELRDRLRDLEAAPGDASSMQDPRT